MAGTSGLVAGDPVGGDVEDQDLTVDVAFTDERTVVTLRGELDEAVVPEVERFLSTLLIEGHADITIDISMLTFMDSAGMDVLLRTNKVFKDLGGSVVFLNPSAVVRRVFDITGMSSVIEVIDS